MNLKICENLKMFRREHGNTQEELSDHLGISVQAVSKWERGEGYPDITLLPSIAAFYGKTVDELLGCGEMEKHEKMEEIMKQYNRNNNEGRIEDNITLLHNALKEFPGSLSLMSDLAFSLLWSNKEEYMDECIEISEKILDKSLDDSQRDGALQTIIYAYVHKGNRSKAKEYTISRRKPGRTLPKANLFACVLPCVKSLRSRLRSSLAAYYAALELLCTLTT